MSTGQLKRYAYSQSKMGSPFQLIFFAADAVLADELAAKCFALVDTFNMIFSDYDPDSELSRLGAAAGAGPQTVSPALLDIFIHAEHAWQKSKGAYDITAGPVVKCWRHARKERQVPDDREIRENLLLTGFDKLVIDRFNQQVTLPVKGMQIDLGGIAKGYIAHKVLGLLSQHGIAQALVDAGGDIVMSDPPPGKEGWIVGVNIPENTAILLPKKLSLRNMAVATSGDAYQCIVHNGKKYSHIIDPRTGYGITTQKNVTIIARDGTIADWLATACSILPIPESRQLVESLSASFLITELQQGQIIGHTAGNFSNYWKHS